MNCWNWYSERISKYEIHIVGVKDTILSRRSEFQKIELVDTYSYGRCLFLDGRIQSSELDEYIYHEVLVHPPMILAPNHEKVLIIGGGEGATLREVLKYQGIKKALMVDIDSEVVEISKKYLRMWHAGSFDDERAELIIQDAREFLLQSREQFDVVIIDCPEPIEEGPAYKLFTKEFYQSVKEHLTPQGILSVQSGAASPTSLLCFTSINKTLQSVFPSVYPYTEFIPSFCSEWGFILASSLERLEINQVNLQERIEKEGLSLSHYCPEIHTTLFSLPPYLREALKKDGRIISESEPLFVE